MLSLAASGITSARGAPYDVLLPAPAAGKEWSYKLPSGYGYMVLLGHALFTSSAQVANRGAHLVILDGDGLVRWRSPSVRETPASKTDHVSFSSFGSYGISSQGGDTSIELPGIVIPAGWSLASETEGLQTEDTWTQLRLYLAQLLDDEPGRAPGESREPHLTIDLERGAYAT
jgi:hypothetical protein